MSTTNPAEFHLETLPIRTVGDWSTSGTHEDDAAESLVEQIQAVTCDIERQITSDALEPGAALDLVAARTLTLTEASGVAIGLVAGNEVVCRAAAGTAPDLGARIEIEKGLSGKCIYTGKIVRWEDGATDSRVNQAACQVLNLRAVVVVPIHAAGKVIGVLEVFSAKPNAFDDRAVLAMSQIARFIGRVTTATPGPSQMTAVPAAAQRVSVPAAPVESSDVRAVARPISSRRWRIALLTVAALITVSAASYRLREMLRSTRAAHDGAAIDVPRLPPSSAGETAAPTMPISPEPATVQTDGQLPATSEALMPSGHGPGPNTPKPSPARVAAPSSQPLPHVVQHASGSLRETQVAPAPPALAAVQPATQDDNLIGPLMKVPVADPKLAAAQATPAAKAQAGRPGFIARVLGKPKKLKVLLEKDSKKNGDKSKANAQPQAPLHEN